jgi:hypothetical protein
VKAVKSSAHACAFNFHVPKAVDGVKIVIEGLWPLPNRKRAKQ